MALEGHAEIAHERLAITFDGPALADNAMDVRDFAPALLGWSGLFHAANRVVYPGAPDVTLEIRAITEGSVKAELAIYLSGGATLFASDPATALTNLKTLVIDPVRGVISLLVRRRRAKGDEVREDVLDSGDVKIAWPDGAEITYPASTVRLGRSVTVKREIQSATRPLARDGIDRITVSTTAVPDLVINAEDADSFEASPEDEPEPIENTIAMKLNVVAPAFDGKKWRVSDGASKFWVAINDPEFQSRIDSGEQFAKGDELRAQVEFVQREAADGKLILERSVVKVLEHKPKPPPPPTLGLPNGA